MRTAIVAAALLSLTACSSIDDMKTKAADLCRQGQPILDLAALSGVPAVVGINIFVAAFCKPLLAGTVPATLDANSASWLTDNLAELRRLLGTVQ